VAAASNRRTMDPRFSSLDNPASFGAAGFNPFADGLDIHRLDDAALFDEEAPFDAYGADHSVIGPTDDRFPITSRPRAPSTLLFPFNTICLIEVVDAAGKHHRAPARTAVFASRAR